MTKRKGNGFSLIELMAVIVIIAVLAATGLKFSGKIIRQNNTVNQIVSFKSSFHKARAFAVERNVGVLFDYSKNGLLIIGDSDRGPSTVALPEDRYGTPGDTVIMGQSLITPVPISFKHVSFNATPSKPLDHWTGAITDIPAFTGSKFYISPQGHVLKLSGGQYLPDMGAIFIKNTDDFEAALYISMLGDVKYATLDPNTTNGWVWSD